MRTSLVAIAFLPWSVSQQYAVEVPEEIRFSKILPDPKFVDVVGAQMQANLPLSSDDYPIDLSTFRWLRYTRTASIVIPEACKGCQYNSSDLISAIGGPPTNPSSDLTDPYWGELAHVVDMQHLRLQGVDPKTIMPLPDLWKNMTIEEVAEAVHDEYPGVWHAQLIDNMRLTKTLPSLDYNIIPFTCATEFLRGICMYSDLVTWAVARVGPMNFGIKYFVGRARPEEVAYKISKGSLRAPPGLVSSIRSLNLTSATSFTAYPEGSPTHPSWPAMHSAGSAMSLWFPVVTELSAKQLCQVKLTDYAVSYARTIAGVHYVGDNIAGLNLGQEIIARTLPSFLNENYGSSISRVTAKIKSYRFDWSDFLDSDCAKGLVK